MSTDKNEKSVAALWNSKAAEWSLITLVFLLSALLLAQGARRLLVGRHERAVLATLQLKKGSAPERDKVRTVQEYDKAIMAHGMLGQTAPTKLWGIMGDNALFGTSVEGAQVMKVGDTIEGGEKIAEIRLNEVVLEKDGQRRTEIVFETLRSEPAPNQPPPAAPGIAPKGKAPSPNEVGGTPGKTP